jgi:hypothetical protein
MFVEREEEEERGCPLRGAYSAGSAVGKRWLKIKSSPMIK